MKRMGAILAGLLLSASVQAQAQAPAQSAPPQSQAPAAAAVPAPGLAAKVEAYLRKLYALGPQFQMKIGTLNEAAVPGFYEVAVEITSGGQNESAVFYVSKDGRHLLRGDIHDLNADHFAANRAKIKLDGAPSKGPANASVVFVEYADFQCPSCRQLHEAVRQLAPRYPQVRFVFKDYPLTQIHPWAMTAALAGRCAYRQQPAAFWKLHDSIFDNQERISTENVWQTMIDYAAAAGLDTAAFRTCMADPATQQSIEASLAEGRALRIANTPTVFINGRRFVSGDLQLLQQYLDYEVSAARPPAAPPPTSPTAPPKRP